MIDVRLQLNPFYPVNEVKLFSGHTKGKINKWFQSVMNSCSAHNRCAIQMNEFAHWKTLHASTQNTLCKDHHRTFAPYLTI